MRITILVDNICNTDNLQAQHGLSLFIELSQGNILFDMGQDALFSQNAKALGIDLSSVDVAIVSHGHYDHGGGLESFLGLNSKSPVYVSSRAFGSYFNRHSKYIGLDQTLRHSIRLRQVTSPINLFDGVTLFPASGTTDSSSQGLFAMEGGHLVDDCFLHEQYLLIEENEQRILFSGCSHRGVLSILQEFDPNVFVGGLHLSHQKLNQELIDLACILRGTKTRFYTCHCTGIEQFHFMSNNADNLHYLATGNILTL